MTSTWSIEAPRLAMCASSIAIAVLALTPCGVSAEHALACKVTAVTDGDTLICFDPARRKMEKIRMRGIDAPESNQAFGQRSKQSLSDLTYGKPATVSWSKRDRWGRILGVVWIEPADCTGCGHVLDANRTQISLGMAWWFRRYASEQVAEERLQYELEEIKARKRLVGLWIENEPVAPWDWRKSR